MSTTVVALVSLTRLIAFDLGKSRDVDEIDHHHHADSGSGSLSVETRMSVLRTDIDGGGLCKRSASMVSIMRIFRHHFIPLPHIPLLPMTHSPLSKKNSV